MKISYYKHGEINKKNWDSCIRNSVNGTIYAYSWFLDIVNEDWDAIVGDNYKFVMPVTKSKKYFFNYISQPLFTQQLGVFTTEKLSKKIIEKILQEIPEEYRYININLNKYNFIEGKSIKSKWYNNYELDLISTYKKLHFNYSNNTKRNIKKAVKNDISINYNLQPNIFINLIKESIGKKLKVLNEEKYNMIRKIISRALLNNRAKIYAAYTKENELCSAAFFVTVNRRAIFLFGASTETGKQKMAMYKIFDEFIKNNSEKKPYFRF